MKIPLIFLYGILSIASWSAHSAEQQKEAAAQASQPFEIPFRSCIGKMRPMKYKWELELPSLDKREKKFTLKDFYPKKEQPTPSTESVVVKYNWTEEEKHASEEFAFPTQSRISLLAENISNPSYVTLQYCDSNDMGFIITLPWLPLTYVVEINPLTRTVKIPSWTKEKKRELEKRISDSIELTEKQLGDYQIEIDAIIKRERRMKESCFSCFKPIQVTRGTRIQKQCEQIQLQDKLNTGKEKNYMLLLQNLREETPLIQKWGDIVTRKKNVRNAPQWNLGLKTIAEDESA